MVFKVSSSCCFCLRSCFVFEHSGLFVSSKANHAFSRGRAQQAWTRWCLHIRVPHLPDWHCQVLLSALRIHATMQQHLLSPFHLLQFQGASPAQLLAVAAAVAATTEPQQMRNSMMSYGQGQGAQGTQGLPPPYTSGPPGGPEVSGTHTMPPQGPPSPGPGPSHTYAPSHATTTAAPLPQMPYPAPGPGPGPRTGALPEPGYSTGAGMPYPRSPPGAPPDAASTGPHSTLDPRGPSVWYTEAELANTPSPGAGDTGRPSSLQPMQLFQQQGGPPYMQGPSGGLEPLPPRDGRRTRATLSAGPPPPTHADMERVQVSSPVPLCWPVLPLLLHAEATDRSSADVCLPCQACCPCHAPKPGPQPSPPACISSTSQAQVQQLEGENRELHKRLAELQSSLDEASNRYDRQLGTEQELKGRAGEVGVHGHGRCRGQELGMWLGGAHRFCGACEVGALGSHIVLDAHRACHMPPSLTATGLHMRPPQDRPLMQPRVTSIHTHICTLQHMHACLTAGGDAAQGARAPAGADPAPGGRAAGGAGSSAGRAWGGAREGGGPGGRDGAVEGRVLSTETAAGGRGQKGGLVMGGGGGMGKRMGSF